MTSKKKESASKGTKNASKAIKLPLIKTPLNAHLFQKHATYEINNEASATIPDQTMSLRTILERYSRGLPISGTVAEPMYSGEEGLGIDIPTLDLEELAQLKQKLSTDVETLRKKIQDEETEKEQARLEKMQADVSAALEAIQAKKEPGPSLKPKEGQE